MYYVSYTLSTPRVQQVQLNGPYNFQEAALHASRMKRCRLIVRGVTVLEYPSMTPYIGKECVTWTS